MPHNQPNSDPLFYLWFWALTAISGRSMIAPRVPTDRGLLCLGTNNLMTEQIKCSSAFSLMNDRYQATF